MYKGNGGGIRTKNCSKLSLKLLVMAHWNLSSNPPRKCSNSKFLRKREDNSRKNKVPKNPWYQCYHKYLESIELTNRTI